MHQGVADFAVVWVLEVSDSSDTVCRAAVGTPDLRCTVQQGRFGQCIRASRQQRVGHMGVCHHEHLPVGEAQTVHATQLLGPLCQPQVHLQAPGQQGQMAHQQAGPRR
eukprot:363093-Chlamydomonas_euryale.AAC.1